jgi:two-component system, OmpR family, response regulator
MAKVLLIDDDIDFLIQEKMQLETDGHEVTTAETVQEALDTLNKMRPDLVIVDLMIDDMDSGFTICHKVKKKDPKIPVIMVTAVTSETGLVFDAATDDEKSWLKADALLAKPVRFDQLKREIARLLKG